MVELWHNGGCMWGFSVDFRGWIIPHTLVLAVRFFVLQKKYGLDDLKKSIYIMSKYVDFGLAVRAIKEGKRVRCEDWPESKKFIFQQVNSAIGKDIVPKMQSLPQTVKDHFQRTFDSESEQIDQIAYANQIAIVGLSNLVEAYSPTCADVLSDWWLILD